MMIRRLLESKRSTWFAACLGVYLLAVNGPVHAQTPRIQGQGTAASGQGNAFAAQADDASALHYNPAGMTQLRGVQVLQGALFIGGVTNFTSSSTGVNTTGDRDGSVAWPPPAHLYIVANLKDIGFDALENWTAGVGVNVPWGSLTHYPIRNPFSATVTFVTNPLLDIKPTVAYKLNDYLSFGLGADIYTYSTLFGEGQVESRSTQGNNGAGPQREINGSGTGAGFNVSMMYTPMRNADGKPIANIGLIYRSQAVVPLSGQVIVNGAIAADAKADLVLPPVYAAAVALWPVRDREREWKLEMDFDYVGWKRYLNQGVSFSNTVPAFAPFFANGIPTVPAAQDWSNSYNVAAGTEYKFLKIERMPEWEVALRAGFTHTQTQVPDSAFNPGIPSANTYTPSIGIGFTCKENGSFLGLTKCGNMGIGVKPKSIGLDLSFQTAFFEPRTITTAAPNPAVNGTYKSVIHIGAVSLRFNF